MKYLLLLLMTSLTLFASIGKIVAIRGDATIIRDDTTFKAKLGSEVEKKDQITTKNAKLQLIFNDKTIITIGPKSEFKVNEYLNNKKNPKAEFSMIRGTFKTITGKIGKIAPSRFKIKTKSATIGIRGTQFLINASAKNVQVLCTQGAVSVTDNVMNKSVEVPAGFSTEVKTGEAPQPAEKVTASSLRKMKAKLEPKKSKKKKAAVSQDSTQNSSDESSGDEDTSTDEESADDTTADDNEEGTQEESSQGENATESETTDNTEQSNDVSSEAQSDDASFGGESFTSKGSQREVVIELEDSFVAPSGIEELPIAFDPTILTAVESIVQDTQAKKVADQVIEEIKKEEIKKNLPTKIPESALIPDTSPNLIHKDDTKLLVDENPFARWGYWVDSDRKKVDTYLDGISTAESIIQDHISNNFKADYSGDVIGLENGSKTVNGNFKMNVDFGQNHVGISEFKIDDTNTWDVTSSGSAKNMNSAGQFQVGVSGAKASGTMQGQFYGDKAQAVGGQANLKSGAKTLDATFSGVRPE